MNFRKVFRKTLLILGIAVIIIQFFRPEKNMKGNQGKQITSQYPINAEVDAIFKKACYDCHSNTTEYPWYSNIQPIGWWLNGHITDGKKHFNFDEFLSYPLYKQYHKLESIDEVITENEMPLESYTFIHRNAKLDENSKEILMHWSKSMRDSMEGRYPADSLINPKKRSK